MIKDLSDFKSATKRIPKLLQTFDLSKPNIFKLSNSASLNLMARILGYENYNTIKSVFDKTSSKGKKTMKFIQLDESHMLNIEYIIEYKQEVKRDIFNNKDEHLVKILQIDYEGHYHEFIFSSKESATKMLNAINQFIDNDETFFNLDALYQELNNRANQKLNNTDNRANQKNDNNHST